MRRIIIMAGLLLAPLLLASFGATAQIQFIEGKHYQLITPPQPTSNADTVEVIEVFSYACPHCATFQPAINGWHQGIGEGVEFSRIAAVFNASWEPYARAYYTADALGILDASHQAMFDKLHKERKRFRSMDDIAEFFSGYGVSKDDFLKASKSFAIDTKLRRGVAMSHRYGVDGTPSVIVNGKYRTSVSMVGSTDGLITLLNQLIESEAKLIAAEAAADAPSESVAETVTEAGTD